MNNTGKLSFGVSASAVAWFAAGLADMFITWSVCSEEQPFGGPALHPAGRALYMLFTFLLLAAAAATGVWSYRKWRELSGAGEVIEAEARERDEFMAFGGLFVSFTLGVGLVWMCLPLFLIQMCLRAR